MSAIPGMEDELVEPDRPSIKVIRMLEGYGYRREAVRTWTKERADTTLNACQKEEAIAMRRADRVAREQDGTLTRGQPTWMERVAAAEVIKSAVGIEDLAQAVSYTIYCMTDNELRQLAEHLVKLYSADPVPRPARAQREKTADEGGGCRIPD